MAKVSKDALLCWMGSDNSFPNVRYYKGKQRSRKQHQKHSYHHDISLVTLYDITLSLYRKNRKMNKNSKNNSISDPVSEMSLNGKI